MPGFVIIFAVLFLEMGLMLSLSPMTRLSPFRGYFINLSSACFVTIFSIFTS
jgi:hypothetical protein